MFDNPKKDLQRMQKQLLQEEEPQKNAPRNAQRPILDGDDLDRELAEVKALLNNRPMDPNVKNYANGYGTAPAAPAKAEAAPVQEEPEVNDRIGGLTALALVLLAGIVGVAAFWIRFLL